MFHSLTALFIAESLLTKMQVNCLHVLFNVKYEWWMTRNISGYQRRQNLALTAMMHYMAQIPKENIKYQLM